MRYLLAFLFAVSAFAQNPAFNGTFEVHIGTGWTTGRVSLNDSGLKVLDFSFRSTLVQVDSDCVTGFQDTTEFDANGSLYLAVTMHLCAITNDSLYGYELSRAKNIVCDSTDCRVVWCRRVREATVKQDSAWLFEINPNPANNSVVITFRAASYNPTAIDVYSEVGEHELSLVQNEVFDGISVLHASTYELCSGAHVFVLRTGGRRIAKTVFIIH